jgi:hypothetical protein
MIVRDHRGECGAEAEELDELFLGVGDFLV